MSYPNQPQWDPSAGQQPNPYGGQPGYRQQPGYPQQSYGAPQSGGFQQPGYGYLQQPYGYGPGMPGSERRARNDWISAIILIIAGAFGIVSPFPKWFKVEAASFDPTTHEYHDVAVNGTQLADLAGRAGKLGAPFAKTTLLELGIWAVLVGGILLVLAAVVLLIPMRNRKITGAIALVVSALMLVGPIVWLATQKLDQFSTGPGYHFFFIAGPIGIIGSIVALVRK